jgi:regulator of RNase E activity RraA
MQALYAGDAGRARTLLKPDDELSVFEAAAFGRIERLRAILGADASQAHAFSEDGFTALHLAVFGRQEEAARILIEHGAGVDTVSTGAIARVPPLGTAAFVRSVPLARLLLDAGADVDGREGGNGPTALRAAVQNGDDELVRLLLGRGADASPLFAKVPTTTLADLLVREQVMDIGIRPLWASPRVAGPAFTVRCPPGDNLMLHAAIHRAEAGSMIVVESGDLDYALAGGNVCAVAQRRGIAAFVLDGVIRDLAEVRDLRFPVFARGVIPIPGAKAAVEPLGVKVRCGGVSVGAGDVVVADEDGVVVVPAGRANRVLEDARAKVDRDAQETLDAWEEAHRKRIDEILEDGRAMQ